MTRFSGRQCQANAGAVSKFANQQHIRIFTQACPQARRKVWRVAAYFSLMDQTLLRMVNKFNGVLKRQDVGGTMRVDVV